MDLNTNCSDSEKLHFAQQKALCDSEYYKNLTTKTYINVVFLILTFMIGFLGGAYGYTYIVSAELNKKIEERDRLNSSIITKSETNTTRITALEAQFSRIETSLQSISTYLLNANITSKQSSH